MDRPEFQPSRTFPDAVYEQALESWTFVDLAGKRPIFTSPFGDVFFQAQDGFWYLDILEGRIDRRWESAEALTAELQTPEGQDRYLLLGLAWGVHNSGTVPGPTEVYDFTVPPRLGAPTDRSNVTVRDFVVTVHLAGQLHRQIRDLPPGTPITGFTIDDS